MSIKLVRTDTDSKRLTVALALIVGFMGAEVVIGILTHSLAFTCQRGDAVSCRP